jgi:uncharacterized protein YjbI with pentapeptide repeats
VFWASSGLQRGNFQGCDWRGQYLTGLNLADADLTGANLSNTTMFGTNLANANLLRANLTNAIQVGGCIGHLVK